MLRPSRAAALVPPHAAPSLPAPRPCARGARRRSRGPPGKIDSLAGAAAASAAAAGAAAAAASGRGQRSAAAVRAVKLEERTATGPAEDEAPSARQTRRVISIDELQGAGGRAFTDVLLRLSPVIIVLLSALTFNFFPQAADFVAGISFMNFDLERGRPVADQVLTSIVVPGLGILFATLSSSTLSVLRARQQEMRKSLRQEAILVDSLAKPLRKLFREQKEDLHEALSLLEQYCIYAVVETEDTDNEEKNRLFTAQRRLTSSLLDLVGKVDETLIRAGDPTRAIVLGRVVGYAQSLVNRLDQLRASRRSTTCFTFPLLHWAILLFLALSLPTSALVLASTLRDTSPIVYGDLLVRVLIATITGAPLLLLVLLADLNEPYAGYVRLTLEPDAFRDAARDFRQERTELRKGR